MRVVHLMASPFFGGPERQMLGLARHLPGDVESLFLSFAERGLAQAFLDEARRHGFEARALIHNTPRYFSCVAEVAAELRTLNADLLCCSGYKPDLVGWRAARRVGIPVVSVSHGWTAATWKVRFYEMLDRLVLYGMDAVVCVSKAQADKVRAAGVAEAKIAVIQNAIGAEAFVEPDAAVRAEMASWFARPPGWIVGAAGRLSPEKGFRILVEAASLVVKIRPEAGFVLFGDGPLRGDIERLIAERGLGGSFVLAGFRNDLPRYLPNLDVHAMSSFTEGLPVVLLEASAAGVATVATAVGGIPELIDDGKTGYLVPAGNAAALAQRILNLLGNDEQRRAIGRAARERVRHDFSFESTSKRYHDLFQRLVQPPSGTRPSPGVG
jgi:glycosyltransferase involved in cell wall biosynthesis